MQVVVLAGAGEKFFCAGADIGEIEWPAPKRLPIGPLVNFQPFYDAFGIKEGDKLWKAPADRAKIW